jgi:hypothetical protein
MELEEDSILMEETAGSEFETESDNDGSTHSPPALASYQLVGV